MWDLMRSKVAMTTKASKARALPKFWVSICSYKKQPVEKIWGRIFGLVWLKIALAALRRTSRVECPTATTRRL